MIPWSIQRKPTAMVFIILFGAAAFTGIFMSLDGDDLIIALVESMGLGRWGRASDLFS